MTRQRLPDRRASVTDRVEFDSAGRTYRVHVTVGFDAAGAPREVFCAAWKSGAELQSIVIDACILMSRLLQHGDDPVEIAATLCRPPSVLGQVAAVVAAHSAERASETAATAGDRGLEPVGSSASASP